MATAGAWVERNESNVGWEGHVFCQQAVCRPTKYLYVDLLAPVEQAAGRWSISIPSILLRPFALSDSGDPHKTN